LRHTIRALGWIITILWIILLILPVTVAFSLMRIIEVEGIGIQEPRGTITNGNLSITIPFYIDNAGFYDLTDLEVNLHIYNGNKTLATSLAKLPNVQAGEVLDSSCNFSQSLKHILSENHELLTKDAELLGNASLRFRVASTIAFGVTTNFTMQWGAPFSNLATNMISYDPGNSILSVSVSFKNQAFFQVNGSIAIELYNSAGELAGSAVHNINVPSGQSFQSFINIAVDPAKMSNEGVFCLYFASSKILEREWKL